MTALLGDETCNKGTDMQQCKRSPTPNAQRTAACARRRRIVRQDCRSWELHREGDARHSSHRARYVAQQVAHRRRCGAGSYFWAEGLRASATPQLLKLRGIRGALFIAAHSPPPHTPCHARAVAHRVQCLMPPEHAALYVRALLPSCELYANDTLRRGALRACRTRRA